jgi:simple sugar transport system permease protein
MFGVTLLKLRRRVDEGIVTLLVNIIMMLIMGAVLGGGALAGPTATKAGMPFGLVFAIAAAVLIAAVSHLTVWGFGWRATAGNVEAARYAGIPVARVTLRVGILSGALAGLAGACPFVVASGTQQAGLGYAGIAVAVLARFSPLGSIVAGLFIAILIVGAETAARNGPPSSLPAILVALTLAVSLIGFHARDRAVLRSRPAS